MNKPRMIGANKKPQVCAGGHRLHRLTAKKPSDGLHSYEFRQKLLRAADQIINPQRHPRT